MFKKHNENPKGIRTCDCVIRAIATATKQKWDDAYRDLFEFSFNAKLMLNDNKCYALYLQKKGLQCVTIKNPKGSKRPTVKSFTEQNPKGTFILSVANHILAVKDGEYLDTFDCGRKSLYKYWIIAMDNV